MTLDYDTDILEFVSAKSVRTGVNLVQTKQAGPGKLRLILASEGSQAGVIGDVELVEITMKAKALDRFIR